MRLKILDIAICDDNEEELKKIDIGILEISMDQLNGIELGQKIKKKTIL